MIRFATACRLLCAVALVSALLLGAASVARAHGGRIKPPDPKYKPGDGNRMPGRVPTDPPPMPAPRIPGDPNPNRPPPPLTPGPGDSVDPGKGPLPPSTPRWPADQPPPTRAPVTPAPGNAGGTQPGGFTGPTSRGRRARTAAPWLRWEMWWSLNRWRFFPARGDVLLGDTVVTPAGGPDPAADVAPREAARRALVTRLHILPFLRRQLTPQRRVRDEVRAAALIALAKLSGDEADVERLFTHAESARSSGLVRESAALAVGMLRRAEVDARMDGPALDRIRARLLKLVDDDAAPDRTRAFAGLSIGMLGDQPFGSAFTKEGRVITRALWDRALAKHSSRELPVALLTAIGMQPGGGVADEIEEGLQRVVHGRRVGRRSWSDVERSHALTALVRQAGDGWALALFRVATAKRIPASVRQAAFIALGAKSRDLADADRLDAVDALDRGIRLSRDDLSRGLGLIALGRLVRADVAAGSAVVAKRTRACGTLLGEARHGAHGIRGFAALALALAIRDTNSEDADVLEFTAAGRQALARGFERGKEPHLRGAYATALGLLGTETPAATRTQLAEVLADRRADPELRGHTAIALALMGDHSAPVRKALRTGLWDKRAVALRSQAALAMSFLGGRAETSMLVRELRSARSQWVLQQVAAALGRLGDVKAVPAILEIAADPRRGDETRALAIASLGLLGDPEAKPSMLRLTLDANYPARTDALHEAFSIL